MDPLNRRILELDGDHKDATEEPTETQDVQLSSSTEASAGLDAMMTNQAEMLQSSGLDRLSMGDLDKVDQTFQKTLGNGDAKGAKAMGISFGAGPLDAEEAGMMGSDDFMSSSAMGVEDMDKPAK